METNRELYLAVTDLAAQHRATPRSLEHFLRAVLHHSTSLADQAALSLDHFYSLLASGFTAEAAPFDETWRTTDETLLPTHAPSYALWRACLISQIVDLREMAKQGTLNDPHRYFGIDAPRGGRWYNFDPSSYLECALAGTFGGWEPGDTTGRIPVPDFSPEDLHEPPFVLDPISWEEAIDFLENGQQYE